MDDFASYFKNLAVIKMDIEGSEGLALQGGRKVFIDMKIPYIVTEFSPRMLREAGTDPIKYVQEFIDAGYDVAEGAFRSIHIVTIDTIKQWSDTRRSDYRTTNIDIYFTHKDA